MIQFMQKTKKKKIVKLWERRMIVFTKAGDKRTMKSEIYNLKIYNVASSLYIYFIFSFGLLSLQIFAQILNY